jgi:hypothetical protein
LFISSSSSSSSFFSSSKPLNSFSLRDFFNENTDYKEEFNLDLQQLNLGHLTNENIFAQLNTNISLTIQLNNPIVDVIGTNFLQSKYSTDYCLFDYNEVLYVRYMII